MIKAIISMSIMFIASSAFACPGAKCDKAGNCPRCGNSAEAKAVPKGEANGEMCKGEACKCEGKAAGAGASEGHMCKHGQSGAEKENAGAKACHEEAAKLCGAKGPKEIHECLAKNDDKVSQLCKDHLKGMLGNHMHK